MWTPQLFSPRELEIQFGSNSNAVELGDGAWNTAKRERLGSQSMPNDLSLTDFLSSSTSILL